MVYVDESGMDERDNYGYGWSKKGERIHGLKAGRRQGRINMIAGYRDGKLIAPFTIKGRVVSYKEKINIVEHISPSSEGIRYGTVASASG